LLCACNLGFLQIPARSRLSLHEDPVNRDFYGGNFGAF